jgi:anti-sigma factor RsiW
MTCNDVRSVILAFADGRLDQLRRRAVEEHLASCGGCRDAVAEQSDVARVLAAAPETPAPAWLAERINARLDEASGWYGLADWRWLAVRVAPVAGALLIAAGIAVERPRLQSSAQSNEPVSLAQVVESWAGGDGDSAPATSVLWKQDVSQDSMLFTVLAAPADATIGGQSDER